MALFRRPDRLSAGRRVHAEDDSVGAGAEQPSGVDLPVADQYCLEASGQGVEDDVVDLARRSRSR